MPELGKHIISIGAIVIIVGVLIYFFGGWFKWIGNLPGDIRIENENSKVFIPITSMIVLSVLLSLIVNLIRRLF